MGAGASTLSPDAQAAIKALPESTQAELAAATLDEAWETIKALPAAVQAELAAAKLTKDEKELLDRAAQELTLTETLLATDAASYIPLKDLPVSKPLVDLCSKYRFSAGQIDASKDRLRVVWPSLVPFVKRIIVTVMAEARIERGRFLLSSVYEDKRKASLHLYTYTLRKCQRDPNYAELMRSVRSARQRLDEFVESQARIRARRASRGEEEPRKDTLRPRDARRQQKTDLVEILADAARLKPRYDALLAHLKEKTGAHAIAAPIKNIWRGLQKTLMDDPKGCERIDNVRIDASGLCDAVRGSIVASDSAQLEQVVSLLVSLDGSLGDHATAGGLKERIELVGFKDRLSRPTSGGWADIMLYFRFADDETQHICEMQLQLRQMFQIRSEMGGHKDFAVFRDAAELLTAVGYPPEQPAEEVLRVQGSELVEQYEASTRALTQQVQGLQRQLNAVLEALGKPQLPGSGASSGSLLLGFGNPLLDISAVVAPEFLIRDERQLKLNDAVLTRDRPEIDYQTLIRQLEDEGGGVVRTPGGSTQNTIRVAQWISGVKGSTAFVGCIGDDETGRRLEQSMGQSGVRTEYLKKEGATTGTCAVMVGKGRSGSERSLLADISVAGDYELSHFRQVVEAGLLREASIVYSAGYFLASCPQVLVEVGKHTAAEGKTLAINLSAPFVVDGFAAELDEVLYYADIVFGNETEVQLYGRKHYWGEDVSAGALALANLPKPSLARPRMVVVTQGKDPTLVACAGVVTPFAVEHLPKEWIQDTTGAGDAFVGGFLAMLAKEGRLTQCVEAGHYAAKQIISESGCITPNFCLVPKFVPDRISTFRPAIVGFGNPLLDISVLADEAMLARWPSVQPGTAVLAQLPMHEALFEEVLSKERDPSYLAGGATQNTIRVAQWLSGTPATTAFVGCIGDDDTGRTLETIARADGVAVHYFKHASAPTGKCAVLVRGDGERGMCTELSASELYSKEAHFDTEPVQSMIRSARVVYTSAFFITHDGGYKTAMALGERAAAAAEGEDGFVFCVNLAAPFIVEHFGARLNELLYYADIIFGNESEAQSFAKAAGWADDDLESIARQLAALPKASARRKRLAVVTCGARQTLASLAGEDAVYSYDVPPLDKLVDTTGAGDAFVGGFLARLVAGGDLEDCVNNAHYGSSQIIQVSGCKMPNFVPPRHPWIDRRTLEGVAGHVPACKWPRHRGVLSLSTRLWKGLWKGL